MKRSLILCLAAVLLVPCARAAAAQGDVQALLRELRGEAAAVQRLPADLQAAYAAVLDSLLPGMADNDPGRRFSAMNDFSRICLRAARPGAEEERAAVSRAILPKLGPDTPAPVRAWLVRQLQWVGKAEAVPALATFLTSAKPKWSDLLPPEGKALVPEDKAPAPLPGVTEADVRDAARRAIEANPSPEAGAALRAAIHAGSVNSRVAIINSLGARRDAEAVPQLGGTLKGGDSDEVLLAAAAALGRIGTPDAAAALAAVQTGIKEKTLPVVQDAYLRCADQMLADGKKDAAAAIYQAMYAADKPQTIRVAALRGIVATQGDKAIPILTEILAGKDPKMQPYVLPFLQEVQGTDATRAIAGVLPSVGPAAQAVLIAELGVRADPATRPAIRAAVASSDDFVRIAALKALGAVGQPEDAAVLAKAAATSQGPERDAARWGLDHLRGDAVVPALIAALPQADAKARPELIRTLAVRRAAGAMPEIMKATADTDAATRIEAIKGIEAMGDEKSIGALISLIGKADDDAERQAAEKALGAVCARATNKDAAADALAAAMAGAAGPAKQSILAALVRTASAKGLAAVRAAMKDPDAAVQDAAVHAMADWPDAAATADLLAIAQNDPKTANQVLAIRGLVRLAGSASMANPEKAALLARTLAAAKRPEDKRLVLGPLGSLNTVEALRLAVPLMDDQNLKEEAAAAAARIAKSMPAPLPAEVKPAMEKVLQVSQNNRTRRDAQDTLNQMPK